MRFRSRPGGNFRKRYFPANNNNNKTDQDLMWAITAGRSQNSTSETPKQIAYIAQNKFEDFEISPIIKKNITDKNYLTPTPIQDKAIPQILLGHDIIGIANTGTGKTAAFLVPLVNKVSKNMNEKVLIVTPTRELAVQINDELYGFSKGFNIKSALCIGGASIKRQRDELSLNPNFVIGTPGRIKDLINQRLLDLSRSTNVVLDEVDRMVDIGFIRDIKYLISLLPVKRQSLFFSATVSDKVREIIATFVKNPVTISVKTTNTVDNIRQEIVKVANQSQKIEKLHDLLIQEDFNKVLIFGRTKRGVQNLSKELSIRGFKTDTIHGNKSQNQRQKTLDMFKQSRIKILLATDVASRGLDIEDVSHVINFDMPASYDDYIHRIGRTGRANKVGTALTFISS